jgi:clan AA aspartic protease
MIKGVVTSQRVAVVRLPVLGMKGEEREVKAIIDTGFNGSLTLPPSVIAALDLTWRSRGSAVLANGKREQFDIYAATVIWDGMQRRLLVEAANTDPLIGMRLLHGHRLSIHVVPNGDVTIEEAP